MSFSSTTLRPGRLVVVNTAVTGNAKYIRRDIEAEEIDTNGVLRAKWETQKEVLDAAEQEAATVVRGKARTMITAVCSRTAFGLLCPEVAVPELKAAIAAATKLVEDFNDTTKVTQVKFIVMDGKVAQDDADAVKAINKEVRSLMEEMDAAVRKLDVKAIRDAADRTKELGQMLSPDAQARITVALEAARKTATKIKAAGTQAAIEIDRRTLQTLAETRTAFLDIDMTPREIGKPVQTARGLDFEVSSSIPLRSSTDAAPVREFV